MVAATPPPVLASFGRLPPGWHSYGELATSWDYRVSPSGPASAMPRGGILVTVSFPSGVGRVPPLRLVLPRKPAVLLEGTTDTPEYRILGTVRGRAVMVFVDIRRLHPTAAQRRAAQQVLAALRFD